jgi:hypothetical protein
LLGDFNAKVGREDRFKQATGNENVHKISNDNGIRAANFVRSKNIIIKSTKFPNCNAHKFIWSCPDGNTHNHIDHILPYGGPHSCVLDFQSFRISDCDADHCLMVALVRERLAVSKRATPKLGKREIQSQEVKYVAGKVLIEYQVKI